MKLLAVSFAFICIAAATSSRAQRLQRAMVADVVNNSRDRHVTFIPPTTDALISELAKNGAYEVISPQEIRQAGTRLHMIPPFGELDMQRIAKDLGVEVMVTAEVQHVDFRIRDRQREMEVGLIVRARDIVQGELVNGAAERGVALDTMDGHKPDGLMLMEAGDSAARKAASRMAGYRPVIGTVLNSAGNGLVIVNRGAGDGVRSRQEFVVLRDGIRVGRLRVVQVRPEHTEMSVVENTGGIAPQDRAMAVFPEPKFGAK